MQGLNTLGGGLLQLKDGSHTLISSLHKGAKESSVSAAQNTKEILAQPVVTAHQEPSDVENNGAAMAPYMMPVGLYAACMAFILMYPLLRDISKTTSGLHMWAYKASVMYTVFILMAVVMIGMLMLVSGLSLYQTLLTFVMAALASVGSMFMVVFFNATCGKIRSFITPIFMVLQLGGVASIYSIGTSSGFYNAIHPFVLFSRSVCAFRSTLAVSGSTIPDILVFAGMPVVFFVLSILLYRRKTGVGEEHSEETLLAQFHQYLYKPAYFEHIISNLKRTYRSDINVLITSRPMGLFSFVSMHIGMNFSSSICLSHVCYQYSHITR